MAETNKAIVERINASLAKGDHEAFLAACADNVDGPSLANRQSKVKKRSASLLRQ